MHETDSERPHVGLRFSLAGFLTVVGAIAVYFGIVASYARLVKLDVELALFFWLNEVASIPIQAMWIVAIFVVFKCQAIFGARYSWTMAALSGFLLTALLNALVQVSIMAMLTTSPSLGSWLLIIWRVVHPVLQGTCWALLLIALLKTVNQRENGDRIVVH